MIIQKDFRELGCAECAGGKVLGFDFSMAFQPIINMTDGSLFAQEALVRGLNGEGAGTVFNHVNDDNRYRFDQTCRVKAIKLAAELGVETNVSINFMPRAVYRPELCIRTTLAAAEHYGFPLERIIFEFTEAEQVDDTDHLLEIVQYYRQCGFKTAIDDFGSGYSGLLQLADLPTDLIKLDMGVIRNVDQHASRQAIVKSMVQLCNDLSIQLIAEGVETEQEYRALKNMGVELFQGYFFARPSFESLADVHFSD